MDDKKKGNQENLRIDILNKISLDLLKYGKRIEMADIWQDAKEYITYYTVGSAKPEECKLIYPLLYEIYAFKKTKKVEIFTYPVEEMIFKIYNTDIKVLKFKV